MTIPNNEFSEQFTADMPSADTMYHAYHKYYDEIQCIQCDNKWWRKKDDDIKSDLCFECRQKNVRKLIEQNKDNL